MKKLLLRCGITAVVAAGIATVYLWLNGFFTETELILRYRDLANAFTMAGVLLLGVGALVWVSTTGFFDGIGYALKHLGSMLIPGYFGREKRYGDYKAEMADKRSGTSAWDAMAHFLIIGAVCMAVTAIFMILFFRLYDALPAA